VTGAAGGIGKVTAELFRERGAQLALFDKSSKVASIADEIGGDAVGQVRDRFRADRARACLAIRRP
jgi:NADP-dependent 3-hydroxy acid dehydrogenase YdfG